MPSKQTPARVPGQRAHTEAAREENARQDADATKHVAPHRIVQGGVEVSAEDVARGADTHAAPSAPRTMDQPPWRDALPNSPSGDDVPGPTVPGFGGQPVDVQTRRTPRR